ncbi:MAG: hypothetical protein ABIQ18_15950 [Umezawaea sp.]
MDATIEPSDRSPSPAGGVNPLHSRILGALQRTLLCGWILIEMIAGLLLLPYARLFFHSLEHLAAEFPRTQRWPLFSQARARYERWAAWCRERGWQLRAVLFVLTIGTAAFMWWKFS